MKKYIKSATGASYDVYVDLKDSDGSYSASAMYTVDADDTATAYDIALRLAKEDTEVSFCQRASYYEVGVSIDGRLGAVIPVYTDNPEEAKKTALEIAKSHLTASLE